MTTLTNLGALNDFQTWLILHFRSGVISCIPIADIILRHSMHPLVSRSTFALPLKKQNHLNKVLSMQFSLGFFSLHAQQCTSGSTVWYLSGRVAGCLPLNHRWTVVGLAHSFWILNKFSVETLNRPYWPSTDFRWKGRRHGQDSCH